jgi:hypothetical protein
MKMLQEETATAEGGRQVIDEIGHLIPRKGYSADLGICTRSAIRREKSDPDFPPVIYINGRAYVTAARWRAYKAVLLQRGLGEVINRHSRVGASDQS